MLAVHDLVAVHAAAVPGIHVCVMVHHIGVCKLLQTAKLSDSRSLRCSLPSSPSTYQVGKVAVGHALEERPCVPRALVQLQEDARLNLERRQVLLPWIGLHRVPAGEPG